MVISGGGTFPGREISQAKAGVPEAQPGDRVAGKATRERVTPRK